jgi:uncharacterized protein (TIGR00730 family)
MVKIKALCVFCGSSIGSRQDYRTAAVELGKLLAEGNIQLVYGGGNVGLMGIVAKSCMDAGGEVIGIIPQALFEKEHGHRGISRLEVVSTMHERKARMAELADGFMALPGGIGTFEELLEVLTWCQLGIHRKPVALVNVAGYFDPLIALLDNAVGEGFLSQKHRRLLIVDDRPQAAVAQLLNADLRPITSSATLGI